MTNAYRYNVVVRHIDFEGEAMFEARVREFPDLTEYADTPEEAYALAIDAIETVAVLFAERGKALPAVADVPMDHSGRVTLRLPKSLHRALADAADEEEVSLNQHLVNVLTYFTGFAHAERSTVERWIPTAPNSRPRHLHLVRTSNLQPKPVKSDWPAAVGHR